jgi:hypothetical protein
MNNIKIFEKEKLSNKFIFFYYLIRQINDIWDLIELKVYKNSMCFPNKQVVSACL